MFEKSKITEEHIETALKRQILVANCHIHGRQKNYVDQRVFSDGVVPRQLIGAKALMYSLVTKEYTVEYTTYGPTKNTNRYVGPSPGLAVQHYNEIEREFFTDYVDREGRKYELV